MFDQPRDTTETPEARAMAELSQGVSRLAFEIVDIASLLFAIDRNSSAVMDRLSGLTGRAEDIGTAVAGVTETLDRVETASRDGLGRAEEAIVSIRSSGGQAQAIAEWVQGLSDRLQPLEDRLSRVRSSADRIAGIATEVNILAINARIEAARAGAHGRGFAVVAEAIGQLSTQTSEVTGTISEEVAHFGASLTQMKSEALGIAAEAAAARSAAAENDGHLSAIAGTLKTTGDDLSAIAVQARAAGEANAEFRPVFSEIAGLLQRNAGEITHGRDRVAGVADQVERLVQVNAATGARTEDSAMVDIVTAAAGEISAAFEDAVARGQIGLSDLFDETYVPVPGSDPAQVTTRFTALTDRILPAIQEPILDRDPRIVFCAAVDRNGYLPTHNAKFSLPQGADPVWNAANCRNRRIFDDRVGRKAGKSTAPFLLQVYRRDMGGGEWVLMKDLSAPITVDGRHWGGLRLAYRPE
ncbi:hypothetical protein HKCCE2091_06290 [Rhodobacterales bacterium HKCCE2091]|nr:hypothetical protein [Rhodobacterales bacterium HKCCE2091]